MNATFQADDALQQLASAYELDVIDLVSTGFGKSLDSSPASIVVIEETLAVYADSLSAAQPSEEQIWQFAKAFGCDVGEVLRKHHGCTWGQITLDGKTAPGLRCADGSFIWPWARVYKRLTEGAENNVLHYFQSLVRPPSSSS